MPEPLTPERAKSPHRGSRSVPGDDVRIVELDIPNDVRYIENVVELVRRECRVLDYPTRQLMLNVPVALTEALSNAILRGNRDDPAKHVHVRAEVDAQRLVLEVADEGAGFDLDASLVDPTTPENIGREDGRGLFLMQQLMDRVERVEAPSGSVVRMTLNRE
ncbi:MAG TPA: ATP-binding protein [Gemmatimonadaceae bacterium]|jgi:serine/threonine-protein kinase RsbW|nr:ATP-binding protein [Gemmatimonadaceae bacterium]